jgi:uncharacterized protein involved in response to NO
MLNTMSPVFLSYAFRPFFLAGSLFSIIAVLLWVMLLNGAVSEPQMSNPMLWHGHEMLIGFALATIAGFLLTAVATWTSSPPVHGSALVWLVAAWLVGRVAMLLTSVLPYPLIAALDMAFPLLLAVTIGREIVMGGSKRNYPIIGITLIIATLNLVYHLGASGAMPGAGRIAIFLLVHLVLLLIVVIAGRIIPNFTANWMRSRDKPNPPAANAAIDRLCIALTIAVGVGASVAPVNPITGALAFAAALAHAARLSRWRGLATTEEPLLFVLHVAYAWLPIGYALTGCAVFGWQVTPGAALHAFTMGTTGAMVLAVTTRVALAHTGRALHASRLTVIGYCIFNLAVLVRVFGPMLPIDYFTVIDSSALGWMASFALFIWGYWPVLTGPAEAE